MKILVTGGNGFIARNLIKGLLGHDITAISRHDVNLLHEDEVDCFFKDKYFDVIIHTAINGGSRLNLLEDSHVFMDNMLMYYNLIKNEKSFGKFISFGSGAELEPNTPYGLSKYFIRESMQLKPKCFNIRIFAVFGEDELDTRFIKGNIKRYLAHNDIQVHQDKQMDFFYIQDLVSLVRWVIESKELSINEIECSYPEHFTLTEVAKIINDLDTHEVNINVEELGPGKSYCGTYLPIPFPLTGLKQGIKNVYKVLKNEY